MIRVSDDDTYFKSEYVDNEEFGDLLDFVIDTILTTKIKTIRFGNYYQYLTYTGYIKTYMSQRKNRNSKSLILKSVDFETECNLFEWDEIEITNYCINICKVGMYIEFNKSISKEYNAWKRRMIDKNGKKINA